MFKQVTNRFKLRYCLIGAHRAGVSHHPQKEIRRFFNPDEIVYEEAMSIGDCWIVMVEITRELKLPLYFEVLEAGPA